MFDFNAFAPPLSSTATLIKFQASSDQPAGYQVHVSGTGLSYNSATGTFAGTITKVIMWDSNTNSAAQTMNVASPAALLTRTNAFLQSAANFGITTSAWFGNQTVKIDDANIVLGGTFALIPILSAADVLLGYIRATGTNLTDANIDTTGVITSVVHEDTSNTAVPGDVISSGVTPASLQYGMLKLTNGVQGNDELINAPLSAGSDTYIATGKAGSLDGGAGNDTYVLGSFNNFVVDTSGSDTITSTISRNLASSLFTGIENLTLLGSATTGVGNGAHNTITGNAAANTLTGALGNDLLKGLAGSDTLRGDAGNDTLVGGAGRDILTGGANADHFKFDAVGEMGKTATTRDVIKDFVHLGDKINLVSIDANGTVKGDPAFQFLALKGAAFTGVKGQIHWLQINSPNNALDKTIIEGDINGDKKADFQIELTGLKFLNYLDFGL